MTKKFSVLIVDDIPEHIAYAGRILKNSGYTVYAVTSGKDALEFLAERRPDIIMLDIKMDDMDGLEVCRRIKSNENTKNIPVIFITSENNPEVIKQGFAVGGCDYIVKPFTNEEYLARVKTHIENSHQKNELIATNNELNMFCSSVSHDLKSPLNAISMLIDTLKDISAETGDTEIIGIADMIDRKVTKLADMVDSLLEFSRMCNVIPESEQVDIEMIFRDVFSEFKSLEPDRNILFECDKIPHINGDEVLIEMIVKNLMSNAFKFTSHKENAIIEVKYYSENGCHIISVKDNGAGFDMKYADKIFKIFQRLHSAEKFDGNGVGLALCQRIMERHGGKIEAYGEVDEGSEFKLSFPE
ncbi:MAG: response regulator [Ruminococcus flavefaciens]|nr:response regulator [Ruminococcus flavefaciens]